MYINLGETMSSIKKRPKQGKHLIFITGSRRIEHKFSRTRPQKYKLDFLKSVKKMYPLQNTIKFFVKAIFRIGQTEN